VRESLKIKPFYSSVAYIGAYPEFYFSLTTSINPEKESIEELFLMDSSMEQLGKTQYNMSKILKKAKKWYLQMDYDEIIFEENSIDMIVMNDNMNINFSEDLEKTMYNMTSYLKDGGVILGTSTSKLATDEIIHAIKGMNVEVELTDVPQNVHYPHELLVYNIKKNF